MRNLFASDKKSFLRKVVIDVVMLALTLMVVVVVITVHYRANSFRKQKEQIRHSILSVKMNTIKQETMAAYRYIQYARKSYYEEIITDLKRKINNDYERLQYVNATSANKAEAIAAIQKYYRYQQQNHSRNFFINTLDGRGVVSFSRPQDVGKNVKDLADYRGNSVVDNELAALQSQSEALLHYQLQRNDTSLFSRKVSFIKKFTPLNLYIGEIIYLEDYTKDLKDHIISFLANIRFGEEGYLFVNTTDGYALIKDGEKLDKPVNIWNLTDPNGIKVIQEEYKAAQNPNGDYIYYSWRKLHSDEVAKKVSYVRGVEEFDWMIGAGAYLDDINKKIGAAERDQRAELLRDILLLTGVFILLVLTGYFILRKYVSTEQHQLKLFTNYFRKSGSEAQLLDTSYVYYSEFQQMAEALNEMVVKHQEMNRKIMNDRLLLRYLIDAIPDSISYKDTNQEYVGCNKAFEYTFGISLERIRSKKTRDLFAREAAAEIEEMEKELFDKRQPVRKEVRLNDRNKNKISMDVLKTFYYDQHENILGIITIARKLPE